ncbi:MAG: O-antigen ligase family protein, partial [Anaerolineae bacterium]
KDLAFSFSTDRFLVGFVWQPAGFVLTAVLLGVALAKLPLLAAVGLVAGTAVFILILIEPLVGVALALLAGPLGAWEAVKFGPSPLDSGQIILLLTAAAWLAQGLSRKRIQLHLTGLLVPLGLFVLVTAVTVVNAISIPVGLRELLKWVEMGVLLVIVVERVDGRASRIYLLLSMLLLPGVLQAAFAFWQFALRGSGPAHFQINERLFRAYGTFMQPNPLGGYINLTALLALGTLLGFVVVGWQNRGLRRNWGIIALLVGTVGVTGLGLLASWSRGAWLGFAAALPALLFFWPRKRWHGFWLLVGTAIVGGGLLLTAVQFHLLPSTILDRLTGFQDDLVLGDVRGEDITNSNFSVLERLAHWQAAVGMARDHLWLGVGFGNYEPAYADYALINWPAPLGHAHNFYLNMLAETGVIGLGVYLLFWTAVFVQIIRLLEVSDWRDRGILLGLLAAWTAVSIHHLVDKLYVNNIYIHMGVMFGLQQVLAQKYKTHMEEKHT